MAVAVAPGAGVGAAYRRLTRAYEDALRSAEELRRLSRKLQRAIYRSLLGLAQAVEAKEPGMSGHSARVAASSMRLALALGLSAAEAKTVAQAGPLHDIGKIGVPERLLCKPGDLDDAERELVRRHAVLGAQIVAPFELFADGAPLIRHHHERWDGSGYPEGLAAETIPLGARIVAVADVYDALTSARSYRAALSRGRAVRELEGEAGRTLDARVVAAFLALT